MLRHRLLRNFQAQSERVTTDQLIDRVVERLRGLGYPVLATQGLGGGYQLGRGLIGSTRRASPDEAYVASS